MDGQVCVRLAFIEGQDEEKLATTCSGDSQLKLQQLAHIMRDGLSTIPPW
ncbi:MAG: hypothetical protein L0331_24140 [Chloroflexi bacterium]|nr:hypothetical protein [Chloroflexota bacterium]